MDKPACPISVVGDCSAGKMSKTGLSYERGVEVEEEDVDMSSGAMQGSLQKKGAGCQQCVLMVERPPKQGLRSNFLQCDARSCVALLLSVSSTEAALMACVKVGLQIFNRKVTRSPTVFALRCGAGNTA